MKDADLFPTICGHHWLPVFAARPRKNKLSEQIRIHCGVPEEPTQLKSGALVQLVGDTSGARTTSHRHD